MTLKDESGVVAELFTDDVFNFRVCGESEAILMPGDYSEMTSVTIPDRVVINDEFKKITYIAANAFENCNNITTLKLPKNLVKLFDSAFTGCTGLTNLTLPASLTVIGNNAFTGCTGLTNLTLSESLTVLGNSAFKGCTGLTNVAMSQSLISIGDEAFQGCSKLAEVDLPESLSIIGNSAFRDCVSLKSFKKGTENCLASLTSIGDYAFYNCSSLIGVDGPSQICNFMDKLQNIGTEAFYGCKMLKGVRFNSEQLKVGNSAFWVCSSIKEFFVNWAEVNDNTFKYCTALENLTFDDVVTTIGNDVVSECPNLSAFNVPASVKSIGNNAFNSKVNPFIVKIEDGSEEIALSKSFVAPKVKLYIGRNVNTDEVICATAGEVTFGNMVTAVPANAFTGVSSLTTVNFGGSIETIGENAFKNCKLSELVLSPHVKTIGNEAFAGNNMTGIAIGSEVTEIGEKAFDGSNELTGVSITALTPPTASNNTFSYYDCPLYVSPSENDEVKDAYYNFTRCWYRFTGYDLIPAESVDIEGGNIVNLQPGDSVQLTASMQPSNASLPYIFWRSTNPAIAIVSPDGLVTRVDNSGISARSNDNASTTDCEIIAETLYADVVAKVTVNAVGSGIEDINDEVNEAEIARPDDIYNMQGVCIKLNATQSDIESLAPGLYIIGGKKVLVK